MIAAMYSGKIPRRRGRAKGDETTHAKKETSSPKFSPLTADPMKSWLRLMATTVSSRPNAICIVFSRNAIARRLLGEER